MDQPAHALPWLKSIVLLLGVSIVAVLMYLVGIFYSSSNEERQAEQKRAESKAIQTSKTTDAPAAGAGKTADAGERPALSLTPLSGSGESGRFTARFNRPGSGGQHYLAYLLFLPTPGAVSYSARGSCEV